MAGFVSLISILSLLAGAKGCGITTHIDAAERAREFLSLESQGIDYRELINKHPDAFQAGSPYPDAFYPDFCFDGIYHDVAEDTHWTPFIKAAVDFIRAERPRPWDEATEKLVVFLLAIVQHQVADVNWHSLGISEGFLRTMGAVNYHGSFNAAHSDGDFGGDVVNIYELDMDYVGLIDKWYVPTEDLLEIYAELYGTPDRMIAEVVENCTFLLFLGRLGENIGVIDLLYPTYAESSPFLIDQLNGYYLGGMDDMATWSANVMKHTVTMLDRGTDVCDLPRNPIYIECDEDFNDKRKPLPQRPQRKHQSNPGVDDDWLRLMQGLVDPDDVIVERTNHGVSYSVSDKLTEAIEQRRQSNHVVVSQATLPDAVYDSEDRYGRLGMSMVTGDVNGDGYADLVVGAPGASSPGNPEEGAVYIVYGDSDGVPVVSASIEDVAGDVLHGTELNGRFGHALSIVDINADGVNDLAVSAPSTGADSLQYHGMVYVYFGDQTTNRLQANPGLTYMCEERYCNFGWSLASGDLDDDGHADLVVGSPFAPGTEAGGEQRGTINVLFSGPQYTVGTQITTRETQQSSATGEHNYEWLGYSLSVGHTSDGATWIAAGAPEHRICVRPDCGFDQGDQQAVGRVYLFHPDLTPHTHMTGTQVFAQLGYSVTIGQYDGQDVLAVGAATADAPGREMIQTGEVTLHALTAVGVQEQPLARFFGDREFGRFGGKVQFSDIDRNGRNDVIIAAPLRSESLVQDREAGMMYIFLSGNDTLPRYADQADYALSIGENRARSATSISLINTGDKVQLISSASHSSQTARLAGRIALHHL